MHSPEMPVKDAIIIGAGLSGLTCAQKLVSEEKCVRVLEKNAYPGGVIRSERIEGFLCEAGPNSLLVKSPVVEKYLSEDLRLSEERVAANSQASKRFLVRNGRMLPLPSSFVSAILTPLYSWPAKFRFLGEPWRKPTAGTDTSVAEFVSRRLGPEFLDYGIAPLVSGIFAGDASKLSIRHAFPKVWNLEARSGSLIRGTLALKKKRKASGEPPFRSQLISYQNGLATLTDRQASLLGESLHTQADLRSIEYLPQQGTWQLQWHTPSHGLSIEQARNLIVATPSYAWGQLPFDPCLLKSLQDLPPIDYPPVATLVLGFKKSQITHPMDGFGVLISPRENAPILGAIFSSTLFPNRAPENCVSIMAFLGGSTHPEAGRWEQDEAVDQCMRTLSSLLKVTGKPIFSRHTRWEKAIPQYNLGHDAFLSGMEQVEANFPGIHLLGNFRGGPGLNDVLENALALANKLCGNSKTSP